MKKSEIKNGAILKSANGDVWFKMDNTLLHVTEEGIQGGWMPWERYDKNMRYQNPDYNIIAVNNNVINSRGMPVRAINEFLAKMDAGNYIEIKDNYPKPFLSRKEKEILSAVDEKWKYIVRTYDGNLELYQVEPIFLKSSCCYQIEEYSTWISSYPSCSFCAYNHLFDLIKSTDTKPYEIKELLK